MPMMTYVAWLRGVNVGGQRPVRMEDLVILFNRMEFKQVATYLQSGNVIFETQKRENVHLAKKIEEKLEEELGYPVEVAVRTMAEIESLVRRDPFKKLPSYPARPFVTFLFREPLQKFRRPFYTAGKEMKILTVRDQNVFSLGFPKPNGWYSIPNIIVESEFGVHGTTRSWTTVKKIGELGRKYETKTSSNRPGRT